MNNSIFYAKFAFMTPKGPEEFLKSFWTVGGLWQDLEIRRMLG